MVGEILTRFHASVSQAILVPSSGGVFEVRLAGQSIFSKKDTGRFPGPGEVNELLKDHLA